MSEEYEKFILESQLIDPLKNIVSKLENREFRDVDVKWLENKLKNFTDFAAKTLFLNPPSIALPEPLTIMNEYTRKRFLKAFNTLINYFESF